MKKLLALVLSLVMVLSLATVGTNAAVANNYPDADKINEKYVEAIDVMNAIGVFIGDAGTGAFRPTDTMKRSEVAKVVAYLMSDQKTADAQQGTGRKYTDLASNHWAAGYIEMLTALNVMAGVGDNKVNPDGEMRTIDYAKMLLVALGFDPQTEGLVGPDYQIKTNTLANQVGLFKGNDDVNITAAVTREEAALYAFNAIKSPMVHYTSKGGTININGTEVNFGGSDWAYNTTTEQTARYRAIRNVTANGNDQAQIVEFAEQHFPGLVREDTIDWAGRPSNRWSYNGIDIGNYICYEYKVAAVTTTLTGAEAVKLLGESVVRNSTVTQYWNGKNVTNITFVDANGNATADITRDKLSKLNEQPFAATGKGVLTEIFEIPNNNGIDLIFVSIDTFYASTGSKAYNEKSGDLTVSVPGYNGFSRNAANYTINVEDQSNVKDLAGKSLLANLDMSATNVALNRLTDAKGATRMVFAPVNGTMKLAYVQELTDIKKDLSLKEYSRNDAFGDDHATTTDGTSYYWDKNGTGLTRNRAYNSSALAVKWTFYFDQYGYVIRATAPATDDPYVFITAFNSQASHTAQTTIDAKAIFADDGTMSDIKVDVDKTDARINAYNAEYGLTAADDAYIPTFQELVRNNDDQGMSQYNHWFTFSKSGDVYTLTPYEKFGTVDAPATAAESKANTLNPAAVRIDSDMLPAEVGYDKGYGNDDSVYITVGAGMTGAGSNTIKSVNGVFTGVQNIEIQLWDATQTEEGKLGAGATAFQTGVYFIVDEDQYIIAAVCLGADLGTGNNFVFAVEGTSKEYTDGKNWFWDFTAIVNGELKTLTIKQGSYADVMTEANKISTVVGRGSTIAVEGGNRYVNHPALFQLTYEKENYVKNVKRVLQQENGGTIISGNVYTGVEAQRAADGTDVNKSLKGYSAVNVILSNDENLFTSGNTIYFTYDGPDSVIGVPVKAGAPVFLRQWTETQSGAIIVETQVFEGLDAAIKATFSAGAFDGEISAVIDSRTGIAQWVAIKNDNVKPYNDTRTDDVRSNEVILNLSKLALTNGLAAGDFRSFQAINHLTIYKVLDDGKTVKMYDNDFARAIPAGQKFVDVTLDQIIALKEGERYQVVVNNKYASNISTYSPIGM